jgi:hypothetical protein
MRADATTVGVCYTSASTVAQGGSVAVLTGRSGGLMLLRGGHSGG